MTLDQLRIFVAVAERQHVTRAAEALNLVQSAVSTAIANIEGRHATKLFHQPLAGRGIELTEAGRVFLVEARAVLARAEAAELCARRPQRHATRDAGALRQPDHRERLVAAPPRRLPSAAPTLRSPALGRGQHHRRRRRGARRAGRTRLRRGGVGRPDACEPPPSRGTNSFSWSPQTITSRRGDRPRTRRPSPGPIGCCASGIEREPARPSRRRSRRLASPPAQLRVTLELPSNEAVRAAVEAGGGPPSCPRPWSPPRFGPGPWCGRRSSCQADPSGCCATRSATAVGPPTRCSNSSQRRIPDERACETRAPPTTRG